MTAESFDAILNLTNQVRILSVGDTYPVDVFSVVTKLGGIISFRNKGEDGVGEYNSRLKITETNKFEIFMLPLDEGKSLFNRFGVARCLGYLFLHTKYMDGASSEVCRVEPSTILSPRNVDVFAMSLLMPMDHFLDVANKNIVRSQYNIKMLSDYFQVPQSTVIEYGSWLGTYRWRKDL